MAYPEYNAEQIEVMEGLEAVRERPGMYIGSTGVKGLHHLVQEIVDNSIDEFLAGHGEKIDVILHQDDTVTIRDYGRGIPVGKHPEKNINTAELILTTLHAGGKFNGTGYKISGGLHGVGISVVNALSEWLRINIKRNGGLYTQKYEKGVPATQLYKKESLTDLSETGTEIHFKPDSSIFEVTEFSAETIFNKLQQSAFLNKGLKIVFTDEKNERKETFNYKGGIKEYVAYLNEKKATIGEIIYVETQKEDLHLEIAFQYTKKSTENIKSFANNIYTENGGYHETGFKATLTRTIKNVAKELEILKKTGPKLKGRDLRSGLVSIVSVKLAEPQFEGQTKAKLGNSELYKKISQNISDDLKDALMTNQELVKKIINKAEASAKAREAAKKTREMVNRKSKFKSSKLPGKLADCSSRKPEKSELFLVEGDSAGGSAKQGRDRQTQAILPLKGKILNVERVGIKRMLNNNEIKSIIEALGAGINDQLNIDNLRYHKIIIMTDADVDGAHITTLLLTLFYRYFQKIIKAGMLYVAKPPLYKLTRGKTKKYIYDQQELEEFKKERSGKYSIQRFKGLGEMNPNQLWETTMKQSTRKLEQVTIENSKQADDVFNTLMGKRVKPRRDFIQNNAALANDIDI